MAEYRPHNMGALGSKEEFQPVFALLFGQSCTNGYNRQNPP